MWRSLLKTSLLLPVILIAWHTLVRIIWRFYKFPIPQFLANLIEKGNPRLCRGDLKSLTDPGVV